MTELTLDRVSKHFDDDGDVVVAVDEVSIDVADGEFLVLVGPSGCGKSTTLRMIAGLESVTSGEVRLDDRMINDLPPKGRDIAMVFQSYALYPHMTVRENMAFGLEESTSMPDAEIRDRVEETADLLGIDPLLDRKPGELSGGQQQRVALGRAIVRDPAVFLMDEPLSNLDAKLRAQMRTELQVLQGDLDTTTVYVTHDQTEAMTMGDRIAILNDGRLMQVGTPLECYHEPANRFVAAFVGEPSMNFLEVTAGDGALLAEGVTYPVGPEIAAAIEGHEDLLLGIRPEDVAIERGTPQGPTEVAATVDVVEPTGDENVVYLSVEGVAVVDGDSLIATIGGMQRVESGETVVARLPEEAIHLFDARTGEAVHNRRVETDESRRSSA